MFPARRNSAWSSASGAIGPPSMPSTTSPPWRWVIPSAGVPRSIVDYTSGRTSPSLQPDGFMRAVTKPQKKASSEEVLLHGDSINFTAARVSDKPGRIRFTSAQIEDYKTVEPATGLRSATSRTISRSLRVASNHFAVAQVASAIITTYGPRMLIRDNVRRAAAVEYERKAWAPPKIAVDVSSRTK